MNHILRTFAAIVLVLAAAIGGCSSDAGTGKDQDSGSLTASRGEHDRDGDAHHGEEGEESGAELGLNESYESN